MQEIFTDKAPEAIGVYSQAIKSGNTVYLSGQIPLDPGTMQLCSDDIKEQIRQTFTNLQAVCRAAGGDFSNLVKLNIYLINLENFSLVNEIMTELFHKPFPARAVLGVASLPRGAQVEIDGIMVI